VTSNSIGGGSVGSSAYATNLGDVYATLPGGLGDIPLSYSNGSITTSGLSEGTIVHTQGGDYDIVAPNTPGATYNPSNGYWGKKYDQGGPVTYTGPAWVDGTLNRPELFLNNNDVAKIYGLIHTTDDLSAKLKESANDIIQATETLTPTYQRIELSDFIDPQKIDSLRAALSLVPSYQTHLDDILYGTANRILERNIATTVNQNQAPVTIGDIIINNPVGNAGDLAREINNSLRNRMMQLVYSSR
jgi:hypothetical protein